MKLRIFNLLFLLFIVQACRQKNLFVTPNYNLPPAVPVGLRVFAANDGVVGIEWYKTLSDAVTGYNIYRSINSDSSFIKIAFTSNNFYYDDSLNYNFTYYYEIAAVNKIGKQSSLTKPVYAKPINLYPPQTPENITINARNWGDSLAIYLEWQPSPDLDIKGYEIFRSQIENFKIRPQNLICFTNLNSFLDRKSLKILTRYYYKIVAIDKGNLKSSPTKEISDVILDKPQIIYPPNNSKINYFYNFKIRTVSLAAQYKIVIQSNKLFGTVDEISFHSNAVKKIIEVNYNSYYLSAYKKYYLRIITYTDNNKAPNSYSELTDFTIIPN